MGLRFRKSIKLGNSVKLNIGKKIRQHECWWKGRPERRLRALQGVRRITPHNKKTPPQSDL
jgi:hypothetical protein